jgi:hypothetical protein
MTTDFLSMAREAFSTSTTYFDSSIRRNVEQALRQFQGVHPAGSKYHSDTYKARSRLFRPKTRTTIRKNEATAAEALFSTNDVVNVTPQDGDDPIQEASATVMQELLNYRLKKSIPWFLISMGAYQDAQTVGVCVSYQYWDYDPIKGRDAPVVELLPIENIRIDPGSNWADPINSSPYVIRLIPMYVKDVKARMNLVDDKTGQPKWKKMSDEQLLQAMNSYSDTTRLTRERGRTDSKDQSQGIRDFAVVWVHQNIMEIDGRDQVFYTLGTTAMLSEAVPIEQMYFHGRRPFVMGFSILETHKTYPDGVAGITKDTQAEINEIANQRIDNVKFAMNKRYFVKRSKQVDIRSLTRNVPGSVTMLTDLDDVKVQETNDVTGSSYQEQDRLNLDFDDVAGTFSGSSVQSNRSLNETVGGMNMLTTNANQVSSYQLRTFVETWVEPVLQQLVLLEQHYETDAVVLAMAGKKSQLLQRFGIDEVTDDLLMQELTTSVNVGIGATNPQEQINSFMAGMNNLRGILADGLLQKHGLNVQEVIKELFGKLGYKDGSRFFDTEGQDPQLVEAMQTIQQLEQQLSQKQNPELVAAQIAKIDAEIANIKANAVQTNVASMFAATQAAANIAQMPQIAPMADIVLMESGRQSPTPGGVDPNLPVPEQQMPVADMGQNTSPQFPELPGDTESPMAGIETSEIEGVQ